MRTLRAASKTRGLDPAPVGDGSQGSDGQQAELHGVVQVQVKPLLMLHTEPNSTPSASGLYRSLCTAAGVAQPMSLQPWGSCA